MNAVYTNKLGLDIISRAYQGELTQLRFDEMHRALTKESERQYRLLEYTTALLFALHSSYLAAGAKELSGEAETRLKTQFLGAIATLAQQHRLYEEQLKIIGPYMDVKDLKHSLDEFKKAAEKLKKDIEKKL